MISKLKAFRTRILESFWSHIEEAASYRNSYTAYNSFYMMDGTGPYYYLIANGINYTSTIHNGDDKDVSVLK